MGMSDLISRQSAIEAVHQEFDECLVWDESGQTTADEVERILDYLPTIDAVPVKHGKWIDPTTGEYCYRCSVCEEYTTMELPRLLYHYCPNCGAKMDGGKDDE